MTRQIAALAIILAGVASPALAQERPAPAVELGAGAMMFADDGIVTEGFVGGTGRVYVLPWLSVGPELTYTNGRNHNHLILTGNVTMDLADPSRRVTPFLVVGAGMFRTTESFAGTRDFTHTEGAFTAGGGVRALVGDRVLVGVEARAGWETHVRVNGFVGLRLGK